MEQQYIKTLQLAEDIKQFVGKSHGTASAKVITYDLYNY